MLCDAENRENGRGEGRGVRSGGDIEELTALKLR
jgi:hypothetical protein